MKKFLFLAVLLLMILGACQKEEISPVESPYFTGEVDEETSSDLSILEDSLLNDSCLRSYYLDILNASNASQIPTTYFRVDSKYKASYQHMKQEYDANYGKCSWTSYVIAMSCIVKANCNGCSYPVSYDKVNTVRSICMGGNSPAYGAQITRLKWYCNTYDYHKASCTLESKTTAQRFTAVKLMLNHLYTYNSPFLVIGSCPTSSGYVGHYLIVHGIYWKSGGTGSRIYYTDCNSMGVNSSYYNNLKSMDFTTFLNLMVEAPNNYNMLFLRPS